MKKNFKKEDLSEVVGRVLESFSASSKATILLLEGNLGAGKTTFTQELAKHLGYSKEVVSPTFVIQKRYPVSYGFFQNLIHIDAYRLGGGDDLKKLGWESWIQDSGNIIVLEWPEIVAEIIPPFAKKIKITHIDEETRQIEYAD